MEKIKKFLKEHKVPVIATVVAIVVIIALLLMMGNGTNVGNNIDTNTKTEVSVNSESVDSETKDTEKDYLAGIGTAPEDNSEESSKPNKDNAVVVPGEEENDGSESVIDSESNTSESTKPSEEDDSESAVDSESNTSESTKPSEEPTKPVEPEKPVHACTFGTLKTDASNHWYVCDCGKTANKGAHTYSDEYDADCNTCGYKRSVPTKPVQPETPSTPGSSVNWNGGNITLDSIGVKIPTLTEFNKTGLESTGSDWWWTGSENDKSALSAMNRIYLTCDEFGEGLIAIGHSDQSINGFTVSRNRIWFSWSGGDMEHFSLQRDPQNGYYVLTINQSLKSQDYFGIDTAVWNRDVVRTLISFISSDVNTVYSYIYTGLHEDAKVLNTSVYKSVGDCQVKFGKESYVNGDNWHCVFYIKGK